MLRQQNAKAAKVCLKMGRAGLVRFACYAQSQLGGTSGIDGIARPSPFGRAAYPEEVRACGLAGWGSVASRAANF